MKPSQQKTFDWYTKNSSIFNHIESIDTLGTGEVEIVTNTHIYIIGIRGGLTPTLR